MKDWSADRVDRIKNIVAFLLATFGGLDSFVQWLDEYPPEWIESNYLKFLGPNLPTSQEYNFGLTNLENDELNRFEKYFDNWADK